MNSFTIGCCYFLVTQIVQELVKYFLVAINYRVEYLFPNIGLKAHCTKID